MTISEFLPYANDILIKQITPENFDEITDGTVVFSITVARGRKPKNERAITWAGYMMCIHSLYRNAARDFVRITDRGEPQREVHPGLFPRRKRRYRDAVHG